MDRPGGFSARGNDLNREEDSELKVVSLRPSEAVQSHDVLMSLFSGGVCLFQPRFHNILLG
jgi:hypothetical protein